MAPVSSPDYAGDISAAEAWETLNADAFAQLIDVRTLAEWSYVGVPDLSAVARRVHCIEWQSFPSMAPNPGFVGEADAAVRGAGAGPGTPILFLCRSGARSRAAAIAMTQIGFTKAYNIAGGFEGTLDAAHHRGRTSGWKAAGLPWKQS